MKVVVSGASVPERLAHYCGQRDISVDHLDHVPNEPELCRRVADADFYLLGGDERLSGTVLNAATALKAVSFLGAGAGSFVDLDAARDRSVRVLTTPGANATAVAEFAVGLAIGLLRRILPDICDRRQPSRTSTELTGATVGVLGLGATGTALARMLARGFSCEVHYHSRTRKPEVEDELGLNYTGLDDLFARCAVVFVCCSLTPDTTGLVGDHLLAAGSQPRYLVSTADPRVIDPQALAKALESGALAGIAMDGYYQEPVPDASDDEHGLLRQDTSVFVTSHIAASSANAWHRMEVMAVDNLIVAIGEVCP